jgi:hypothetical protein
MKTRQEPIPPASRALMDMVSIDLSQFWSILFGREDLGI